MLLHGIKHMAGILIIIYVKLLVFGMYAVKQGVCFWPGNWHQTGCGWLRAVFPARSI